MTAAHILAAPPRTDLLTPVEVARAFGVDVKKVGRWERQGKLRAAIRTPGGHRRYAYATVERAARTLGIPWAVTR